MVTLYTENGRLLPPGTNVVQGHEGINNFWQAAMNMGIKLAKLETIEIEQLKDRAIEQGPATLFAETGQQIDQCKYIVIWKMIYGQLKLHKEIWNTNMATS
jgi:ketosteroid isomerase-like protein